MFDWYGLKQTDAEVHCINIRAEKLTKRVDMLEVDKGLVGQCDECRFWDDMDRDTKEDSKILGSCRRYAPKPLSYDSEVSESPQIECGFPAVFGDEWCGEFGARRE